MFQSILLPTVDDQRRKVIYQLINREQNFVTAMQYGMDRFVIPLRERKDLVSPNDHRTLFQNIDEVNDKLISNILITGIKF